MGSDAKMTGLANEDRVGVSKVFSVATWDRIAEGYVGRVPAAHAVFRVAELRAIAGLNLKTPILDLGCGRGEFAMAAIESQIDVGVDLSPSAIREAQDSRRYRQLLVADAASLPLRNDRFSTVLSVSVLEHLADPIKAIEEAYRVLVPGGNLIATVVIKEIHDLLYGSRLFHRIGWTRAVAYYSDLLDRLFQHIGLLSQSEWRDALEQTGFKSIELQLAVGPDVIASWERGFLTAWPYRFFPKLAVTGRCSWRPRASAQRRFERIRKSVEAWEPDPERRGACLVIKAAK